MNKLPNVSKFSKKCFLAFLFTMVLVSVGWGQPHVPVFSPIEGFSESTNEQLRAFFQRVASYDQRKVAVFDADGTLMGQCPHYLADECLFGEAKKYPRKKAALIKRMTTHSNTSLEYVKNRVWFFEGNSPDYLRELGNSCFQERFKNKMFLPMKKLVEILAENGFEIWIVTASPELMYQTFLSREFGVPETRIVGVKSIIRQGKITRDIVEPVPQEEGKRALIETFVQAQPLFAAGNSRGDVEMLEYSKMMRLIINPDETSANGEESLAEYARNHHWLIEKMRDVPETTMSPVSREFGIPPNDENP